MEPTDPLELPKPTNQTEAVAQIEALRTALKLALADANNAHEALGAFMKLEADIQVSCGYEQTERTEVRTSFQTGSLIAALRASEREAFIGCGVAIMRQVKAVVLADHITLNEVIDRAAGVRAKASYTFARVYSGGWVFNLLCRAVKWLLPNNSEIVIRKI